MTKRIPLRFFAFALAFYACSSDSSDTPPSSSLSIPECTENPHQPFNPDLYECNPEINPYAIYLKGGVKDAGDNEYNAVLIGSQVWMAEN
jgi:hypothetical protein